MAIKIVDIHRKAFDYLVQWSDSTRDFNKFFYLRTKDDERFKKEYWFPGDENYVEISFWTGKDSLNRTSNIYISIDPKKGIYGNIIAKDSENKQKYFDKLVSRLDGYKVQGKKKNVWRKKFGNFEETTFLEFLNSFLQNDKVLIDDFLKNTLDRIDEPDYQLLEDEYSSKFGFIAEEQFYKLRNRVETERKSIERERKLKQLTNNPMPISITSIDIEKFQGINKLLVEEIPDNTKWFFLTGENGFGKTSLLQAISLGLTSYEENKKYLGSGSKITIGYSDKGKYIQNSVTSNYNEDFKDLNSNFIAYGPLRLVVQASSSENQENQNSSNIYNIFNRDGLLKNVNYLLKNSSLKKDKSEYDNLRKAIIKVLDKRIQEISIDENGNVQYFEFDDNGNLLGQNRLEHLATGFQGLVNLVGDIIVRFSKTSQNYADFTGIVIIDELENHLHPIFQKKLPSLLSSVFPKIQFITSVHSPIPLLGAPKESVIIKVNRDAEQSITAEKIVIDNIETLNPNILFTSAIFGFSSIINDNLVDKQDLRTENSWQEMKETDDIDKKLLELYNKRKNK
jgi:predicted ATP-binding protein involved in virulence